MKLSDMKSSDWLRMIVILIIVYVLIQVLFYIPKEIREDRTKERLCEENNLERVGDYCFNKFEDKAYPIIKYNNMFRIANLY